MTTLLQRNFIHPNQKIKCLKIKLFSRITYFVHLNDFILLANSNYKICFLSLHTRGFDQSFIWKIKECFLLFSYICKLGHKTGQFCGIAKKRDLAIIIIKKTLQLTSFLNVCRKLSNSPPKRERYKGVWNCSWIGVSRGL